VLPERDNALGARHRQRAEEQRIGEAADGGGHADTGSQHEQRNHRKAGRRCECAQGVSGVVDDVGI
jgi:hypothetical protein